MRTTLTIWLMGAGLLAAVSPAAVADSIVLKGESTVHGPVVTLGEVANLKGSAAEALAQVAIGSFDGSTPLLTLTLTDVRRHLDEHGVHWGFVSLRGPTSVQVRRHSATITKPAAERPSISPVTDHPIDAPNGSQAKLDAVPAANPPKPVTLATDARSLRQHIIDRIVGQLQRDPADVRVTFENDDDSALSATDARERFEIELGSRIGAGRQSVSARRIMPDGRSAGQLRLRVNVEVRCRVLVATTPLQRGRTITDSDVAVKTLWLEALAQTPATDASQVVGRQINSGVAEGSIVYLENVSDPLLVRRTQMVMVRCVSGSLVLKVMARAEESGAMGELIAVRNPRTRQKLYVRVSGPQEAVLIADESLTGAAEVKEGSP